MQLQILQTRGIEKERNLIWFKFPKVKTIVLFPYRRKEKTSIKVENESMIDELVWTDWIGIMRMSYRPAWEPWYGSGVQFRDGGEAEVEPIGQKTHIMAQGHGG